jgi:predicted RNA-binding protein with PIN domain
VFDGDDVEDTGRREGTRGVRVEFSPAGVSADAMLVSAVATFAPDSPVVVVSSDNEVRKGATARGARVLHSEDFFAIART